MSTSRHSLLRRQLRRFEAFLDDPKSDPLLDLISETYDDHDRARERLERAMQLMNEELQEHAAGREVLLSSLQLRTAQFESTLRSIRQGIALFAHDGAMLIGNTPFATMLGYDSKDQIDGETFQDCFAKAPAFAGLSAMPDIPPDQAVLLADFVTSTKSSIIHVRTATSRTLEIERIKDDAGNWIIAVQDISESILSRKLEYLARHDTLTGLANRFAFNASIADALATTEHGERVAIFCMDLDNFKTVNDTMGHHFGDELLKAVAIRLSSGAPKSCLIARLGGDEFAIIMRDIGTDAEVVDVANTIVRALSLPFIIDEHEVQTAVSIGLAFSPDHGTDAQALMRRADIALYKAKAAGGSSCETFELWMEENLDKKHRLERDLKSAISNDELVLYYQPIICARTHEVLSYEALIRWQHPEMGLLTPYHFIPLAEESGEIVNIGRWVLLTACKQAATWSDKSRSVSVNLSAAQFSNRRLTHEIESILKQSGLEPDRLNLEITETVLMEKTYHTRAMLEKLRALGVRIHLDDFGAGYSSFNYILEFGFDRVKIDKVFLLNEHDKTKSEAVLRAIVAFCSSLGIETVVEGIETEQHLSLVKSMSATAIQGFYFSEPVPVGSLRENEDNKSTPNNVRKLRAK